MPNPPPEPNLEIRRRRLPHWTLDGSTYFVTFRVRSGFLLAAERLVVKDHIRAGHGRFYHLAAVVVMPHHVHAVPKPADGFTLSRIMHGVKGVTARLVNQRRGTHGSVWQDESWDRIIRDTDELEEKLDYMYQNPIKAGICTQGEAYDGWYYNPAFEDGRQECLPHPGSSPDPDPNSGCE
jgi:putative transposase